ncbi:MAG TPA: acyloxyacyl hydrolase [Bacteroidales bacterium]|nr:acyloxyacyl hydrolase [Bacteroidales bacterium]
MRIIKAHISIIYLQTFFGLMLMLALPTILHAQEKQSRFIDRLSIESKINYGFIILHHPEMWALTDGYFPIVEASLLLQTDGRRNSQYQRHYPQIGLTYFYSDFGGSEPLGVMHALVPNMRLPLLRRDKIQITFGVGLGVAYLTKKFDRIENYQNLTIGSHYNAAVNFQLKTTLRLNSQLRVSAGISMTHVSNGTIKTPNYGLNMPALFAGLEYKITRRPIIFVKPEQIKKMRGKVNVRIGAAMALKENNDVWDKEFRVYIGQVSVGGYYNNTNRLLLDVDAVYDESTKYAMEADGVPVDKYEDVVKGGISLGHEWTFDRLSLLMNLGVYLYNAEYTDEQFYNKLGVGYRFTRYTYASVTLQAHWAKAEFLSFGLGIII